jgi:hypothetical protein
MGIVSWFCFWILAEDRMAAADLMRFPDVWYCRDYVADSTAGTMTSGLADYPVFAP